jgi:dCTP deaminase
MPFSEAEIRSLARSASASAIAYEARGLLSELERITPHEFPKHACRLRDVLRCWPEFVLEELSKLQTKHPIGVTGPDSVRLRQLANVLREVYSYVRYLTASAPRQAPPAIQASLAQLTDRFFPKANGTPVTVIRPQWKYNWKYVPISRDLQDLITPAALDPDGVLGISAKTDILAKLWQWYVSRVDVSERDRLGTDPPSQLAILSFAGLDTHDSLLYPLLAHELGHFIDYSFSNPLSLGSEITAASYIAYSEVEAILNSEAPELINRVQEIWRDVTLRVGVCIRELLADSLALRMIGFGFFAAQAEFLKTITGWPQTLLTPSGYPGIKFRLWSVFRQLTDLTFSGNPRTFFTAHDQVALAVLHYLGEWEHRLSYASGSADLNVTPSSIRPPGIASVDAKLDDLAEQAVLNALPKVVSAAENTIPTDRTATLTARFHERVARLERDLPPSTANEIPNSFAEILAAAWAYQLAFGEERERKALTAADKHDEYQKTCRLVLKAIELIPDSEQQSEPMSSTDEAESGTVLASMHIRRRVSLPVSDSAHLGIIPLKPSAIQAASLDVHLGNWFVVMRRTRLKSVRISDPIAQQLLRIVGREETFIPDGETFLIHPGDLVLGATREFLALPKDLMGFVEGKSSLGRLGLFVATASQVAPGFHGVVVLELVNSGAVPLELVPGMGIAQLIFQRMSQSVGEDVYHGAFYCQIRP